MKKVNISVTQTLLNGKSRLHLVVEGKVTHQAGPDKSIAEMLLEAEMHGNDGEARLNIDVVE